MTKDEPVGSPQFALITSHKARLPSLPRASPYVGAPVATGSSLGLRVGETHREPRATGHLCGGNLSELFLPSGASGVLPASWRPSGYCN
jgi:hypothetical protein